MALKNSTRLLTRKAEIPNLIVVIINIIRNANAIRRKLIVVAEAPASDMSLMKRPIVPHEQPAMKISAAPPLNFVPSFFKGPYLHVE